MEIIEFNNMIDIEAQEGDLEETPDLVELNSLEFFKAIKPALLEECKQRGGSKLLDDPKSTREESKDALPGEVKNESSITDLTFCAIELNNIEGNNSKLTSEYQMSDANLSG